MANDTILVVDDDELVSQLLARLFKKAGFSVVAARSAGEAIALAELCDPTVVATDYWLPEMTGAQLIGRLRVLHPYADFLLLSGDRLDLDTELPHRRPDRFIAKPFTAASLTAAAEQGARACRLRRQRQSVDAA